MKEATCQLVGGPYDGKLCRRPRRDEVVYQLDPMHDLFHVYRRDDDSDLFVHEKVIDVHEYQRRWHQRA